MKRVYLTRDKHPIIIETHIVRETANKVYVSMGDNRLPLRVWKGTSADKHYMQNQIHDTLRDAVTFLIEQEERKIRDYNRTIKSAQKQIKYLKAAYRTVLSGERDEASSGSVLPDQQ